MDNDTMKSMIDQSMRWAFTLGRQYQEYQDGDDRREIIDRRLRDGIKANQDEVDG